MLRLCLLSETLIPLTSFLCAARSARTYDPITRSNSIVTRAMSSALTQQIFQLKHDPLTGNSEWVVIDENDQDVPGASGDGLLATTSYLDMLNDSPRNRAFRLAIEKTVTKPCHVLDIGAGTGLLSMMSARAMMSSSNGENFRYDNTKGTVTACESYLPMVKLMRKVVHINGLGKKINIINTRSDELKVGVDIASRADVLVSEILDSELLGEGLIPTLQHAHDNLLVENPKTVPYRATTYCQLVECTFLWKLHDLHNNEVEASDGIRLAPAGLNSLLGVRPQQYAMHVGALEKEIKLLSEPIKVFEFDFWKRPETRGEIEVHVEAITEGNVDAIISWWVLQLDREGTIFYSTAPRWIKSMTDTYVRDWCDHWKQCVWFTLGKGVSITKGEKVLLHAVHTGTNVLYNLETQILTPEPALYDSSAGVPQLALPPQRIAIYGDNKWRLSMLEAMKEAGRSQPLCVVADDSVFLTLLLLHLSDVSHVIPLFPGLQENGFRYLEAIADLNGLPKDRIEFVSKNKGMLNVTDTHQKKIDLLIGEPYYHGLEGMLPWHYLRFWKERTMLDSLLSEDALIMPCKGVLRACAMYLPDLWKSRCSLSKIEGFDHSVVNTALGACGNLPADKESPCLPFFVWQCEETKRLSEEFTIMVFDFSKPIRPCSEKVQIEFSEPGVCHGFVLWIDWVMDAENSMVVSTGPDQRCWKQGVKLLSNPVTVGYSNAASGYRSATIDAYFDPSSSHDVIIKHTFS